MTIDIASLIPPDPQGEFTYEPQEYFLQAIHRMARIRDAEFEIAFEPLGLNVTRYRTLVTLVRAGACSMSDLAVLMGYDRTTLARAVDQLVAMGCVERRIRPQDRRVVEVAATEAGRALFERTIEDARRINDKLFENIADGELRTVLRGLERMLANLGSTPDDIGRSLEGRRG
ncbi:MAG TPA: MarR family transcriptional regulator [Caulobacteraceae bacterium]|nr:MarR family transcriptional regulator [Caulobacteraceae bacterium]